MIERGKEWRPPYGRYNREQCSSQKETIQYTLSNSISFYISKRHHKHLNRSPKKITMAPTGKLKIAAIQAEPAWLDLEGGVNKAITLIEEAAGKGANVVGFPEVFIPGYPW